MIYRKVILLIYLKGDKGIVESVGLHGRVLDYMVELGYMWRMLGCIVESVGLYDWSVELYGGEC